MEQKEKREGGNKEKKGGRERRSASKCKLEQSGAERRGSSAVVVQKHSKAETGAPL